MFEHYTEQARRVIFFARYEASDYGSPYIETEHILLGLLRADAALMHRCFGPIDLGSQIRAEVAKVIKRGDRIPTSVEMPLTAEAKELLNFSAEEADRLGHRHIGTEHILLGILRLPDSLAARLLMARGAKVEAIREQITKSPAPAVPVTQPVSAGPLVFLENFLGALKGDGSGQPADYFAERGQFVDSSGKRWIGRKEIEKGAETLFARFAKKNATFLLEDTTSGPSGSRVASVLWEFASVSGDRSKSMLRMSIVQASAGGEWAIVLVQVTPVLQGLNHTA